QLAGCCLAYRRLYSGTTGWLEDSNSTFFQPNDQGTSRLNLSYTQPILRGRGRTYNTALVVLAQIDADIARDEFMRQLQSHLLEITRAYWTLYLERASLLQKAQLYERASSTLSEVEARRGMDAVGSQIARVRAAVADRRAQLIRAQTAVRNAQERIIALVNDPNIANVESLELVPVDQPTMALFPVDMKTSVSTALRVRPEIGQAIKQVRAACHRLGMAKNEILPQLDLLIQGYLAGLRGNDDVGGALEDQFSEGPGYSVGVRYEFPICNRAARARLLRRKLELRQLKNQFDTTAETLLLEVKTAVREVDTSFREMNAKYQAMAAAAQQLDYIQQRWRALAGEERSATLYLEDLLDAQQKLTDAEFGFLTANTTYNLALMNLKRAQGTLLQDESVTAEQIIECNLPTNVLNKGAVGHGDGQIPQQYIEPTTVLPEDAAPATPTSSQTPPSPTTQNQMPAQPASSPTQSSSTSSLTEMLIKDRSGKSTSSYDYYAPVNK
ncbi:MAG: TolC family protein, partial [Planctomycetota bacterium]